MFNWNKLFKRKPPMSIAQRTILKYQNINYFDIKRVFSSDKSLEQVNVCVTAITEYTNLLELIYGALVSETIIYKGDLPFSSKIIFKRDFYTDKLNIFIEPVKATEEFTTAAIKLLQIYDAKESQVNKSFELEKTLSLINVVISNIITLAEEL